MMGEAGGLPDGAPGRGGVECGRSVARELMVLTDPRAGRAESPPGARGGDKTPE